MGAWLKAPKKQNWVFWGNCPLKRIQVAVYNARGLPLTINQQRFITSFYCFLQLFGLFYCQSLAQKGIYLHQIIVRFSLFVIFITHNQDEIQGTVDIHSAHQPHRHLWGRTRCLCVENKKERWWVDLFSGPEMQKGSERKMHISAMTVGGRVGFTPQCVNLLNVLW